MQWTSKKPTKPGFYFYGNGGYSVVYLWRGYGLLNAQSTHADGDCPVEKLPSDWLGPITPESFIREKRYRQALDIIRIMACEMNWGRIQKVAEDALREE